LGFPYIFRGALDSRSTAINEEMKIAAVFAIAALAHESVPEDITRLYGKELSFGRDYILPTPFDNRLLTRVAPAVAMAAAASGVAKRPIEDIEQYVNRLERLMHRDNNTVANLLNAQVETYTPNGPKHKSA
jgi:malate dehydrogenase (oxaloacetate-decarboxylating)(NADP+)